MPVLLVASAEKIVPTRGVTSRSAISVAPRKPSSPSESDMKMIGPLRDWPLATTCSSAASIATCVPLLSTAPRP